MIRDEASAASEMRSARRDFVHWLTCQAFLILLPILNGPHVAGGIVSLTIVSTFFKQKTSPLLHFATVVLPLTAYISITKFRTYTFAIYTIYLLFKVGIILNEFRKIQRISTV